MDNLLERVTEFLTAYSAKDATGVIRLIAPDSIAVYGTDYGEVGFTHPAVTQLLELDFCLWDTAHFDRLHNASVQISDGLATAFFDVAFYSTVDRQEQQSMLRFATVWGQRDGDWYLVQSINTVLTVGHSAAEILGVTWDSPPNSNPSKKMCKGNLHE